MCTVSELSIRFGVSYKKHSISNHSAQKLEATNNPYPTIAEAYGEDLG